MTRSPCLLLYNLRSWGVSRSGRLDILHGNRLGSRLLDFLLLLGAFVALRRIGFGAIALLLGGFSRLSFGSFGFIDLFGSLIGFRCLSRLFGGGLLDCRLGGGLVIGLGFFSGSGLSVSCIKSMNGDVSNRD